ncbi:MAG TPA: ATP-dependent DNA helicase RecG, partial [Gemmatimonadetes bacterium]|nr:ATP-dependent DNA helicase RecG [Gemmatimonadota bacterium]
LNLDKLLEWASDDEYMSESERRARGLPRLDEALSLLHRPDNLADAERGRRRLAFDELFHLQIVQAQARRKATEVEPGISHQRSNELIRPLHEALPFELTEAQARVLSEIYADMQMERRMNRLLQGDVGAGKTIVALFAMLLAAEGGYQSALMAPTEILAEQHLRKLRSVLQPLEVNVVLLTGSLKGHERSEALAAIESGSGRVIIGTHALIQDSVTFRNLGLLIVDEQHRFGVRQRMALLERYNDRPDVLVMSATPIPRSLAMAFYGDLDLSILDELPPGRKPVKTELHAPAQRESVYKFVSAQIKEGRQVYVVYPLVRESDKVDLLAATEEFERLQREIFPSFRLGLLHGQLSASQKDDTMGAFSRGDLDLLVATTVVEVGIDIPNASVMLIEHAERFGLSQLHQLRGRVGRGPTESHCILIAEGEGDALERLNIFRDTTDGFEIARADLRMRGQGDLFGSQQHGRDLVLRFSDLIADEDLLVVAQETARQLIS